MINRSPLLLAILVLASPLFAQNLVSFEYPIGTSVANGDLLTLSAPDTTFEMIQKVYCRLNGSTGKDVKVKRYELVPATGTQHYYCWDVCYLESFSGAIPDWWVCDDPLALTPNVLVSDFKAYHWPNGLSACATYRYVWFDESNVTDSAWVDIQFCTTAVGIEELNGPVLEFSVFPNPAVNDRAQIRVEFNGASKGGYVVLHSSRGEQVLSKAIAKATSQSELDLNGLDAGIYFVSVQLDGVLLRTERLIVP